MVRRTPILLNLLVAALPATALAAGDEKPAAPAAATYEALRQTARPAGDLAELLEPLFAQCPSGGEVAARQCDLIKAWNLDRLREQRFVIAADPTSIRPEAWDQTQKSISVEIAGCLACKDPPVIAGSKRFVFSRAPSGMADGLPVGVGLTLHEFALADARQAKKWTERTLPRLRLEYVFVAPAVVAGKVPGVKVNLVGYRLWNQCTGEIIVSQPPSAVAALDADKTCPQEGPDEEELAAQRELAKLPVKLPYSVIQKQMTSIEQRITDCAVEYELKGTATIRLTLFGDGKPHQFTIAAPFDQGEGAMCLKAALRSIKFPRFREQEQKVDYPYVLQH